MSTDSSGVHDLVLHVIGRVESPLTDLATAPKQADDTAPSAWLVVAPGFHVGLSDVRVGDDLLVITWLHRARRDILRCACTRRTGPSCRYAGCSVPGPPTGPTRLVSTQFG